MFVNYRDLNLCSFIFIITFLSSTALFCSNLSSIDDKTTPCFLEKPTEKPILLRTSSNSLVLPCHVARSKHSTVEWWFTDVQKLIKIKIYPVYPPVRPTVLRFITSLTHNAKNSSETDIIDASILLRNVNVDDSGLYRCIIRPWSTDPSEQTENFPLLNDDSNIQALSYQLQLTAPRLCLPSLNPLPCFTAMRTSSPTIIDAYQTAFLQCVVKNHNRPINVFWVVGDSSVNNVLITDHLTSNQYHGDKIRRVFPLSPFDHSVELSVNRTISDRVYSCVIDGATEVETTLFTYIIRTINLEEVHPHTLNATEKIASHDTLNSEQIHSLRESQKVATDEEHDDEEEEQISEREHDDDDEEEKTDETTAAI